MYLLNVTVTPGEKAELHQAGHREFLGRKFEEGVFLLFGPYIPLTGGLVIARAADREALDAVIAEDPYVQAGVAAYAVQEFKAAKVSPAILEEEK